VRLESGERQTLSNAARFEEKEEVCDHETFNDRLPAIIREDELSMRLVGSGWKFNIFSARSQLKKQLAALAVVLSSFYFSACGLISGNGTESLSMVVGAYSLISMFSMINCTYVRDFDVL
jgi:hypothetical protein